jgi:hypothetical protein
MGSAGTKYYVMSLTLRKLREYKPFGSHQQAVTCLKAMKDYLFSGSYDETIKQWKLSVWLCFSMELIFKDRRVCKHD